MIKFHIIMFFVASITISCTQDIEYDNIKLKNGLFIDSANGSPLDGKYKSASDENTFTFEYSDGIPTGKWTEKHKEDLYFTGEYINEDLLKSKIEELTKSKRADFDFWKELDYPYLTIELIQPKVTDTLTLQTVVELSKDYISKKYNFKSIRIDSIDMSARNNPIYEVYFK